MELHRDIDGYGILRGEERLLVLARHRRLNLGRFRIPLEWHGGQLRFFILILTRGGFAEKFVMYLPIGD